MILVAITLLCLGSSAFTAPTTSTSDNPRALLPHGPLQKREPICDDRSQPKPSAGNCTYAIQAMPMTLEPVVGVFGRPSSNIEIGNPFRLPRYFPHKDCMVLVEMKSEDIAVDRASWNEIAQKALHVLQACVQGETHQHGGKEEAGYRSGIAIELSWNFPEMDVLASLNRPELELEWGLELHTPEPEEQMPAPRIVGKPPLPPPTGRKRPRPS